VGPKADIRSPEQLVAVHILLTPFQDPDHCETMPCVVLTPGATMRRREFITLIGSAAAAWPLAARAQQPNARMPRIGFLSPSPQTYQEEFRRGLRELGYSDGHNVLIEYRFTDGSDERLPAAAKQLVNIPVDVIVCTNSTATAAAISATSTIPIVMVTSADPVGQGFIASLARPGGNVTGLASFSPQTGMKQLEFLKEVAPSISRVAVFWNSLNPANVISIPNLQQAAQTLGVELELAELRVPENLKSTLNSVARSNPDGFIALVDQVTIRHRADLVDFARTIRRPAVYALREFAAAGGLLSYGVSFPHLHFRAADYVNKVIKGARPSDLPVQLPTTFELVINQKTAKALGIELPPTLLIRADEVIE
jgi:putative tryptophan/tyrosine transport system substrate-binding protein